MTSADSCPITLHVAMQGAAKQQPHVGQASPDKGVIFHYRTAAFTLPPESWASSCCADLPGDWALYAISVRRLIVSEFRKLVYLRSGFLQTTPHEIAFAFG